LVCCSAASSANKAKRLRKAVEEAVENGDVAAYQEALKDLSDHMGTLSERELQRFCAEWRDPSITPWMHQMALELSRKERERWLALKEPGATEPLTETVTRLVVNVLGSQNNLPRVKDLKITGTSLMVAYRTYGTSEGRTGRLAQLQDIGQLLKYMAWYEPLSEIKHFQVDAYQELEDEGPEELVMRVKLDRKSIDKLLWTGHVSTRLAEVAEKRGRLWIHDRLQGEI
jgi:hypothetical protein